MLFDLSPLNIVDFDSDRNAYVVGAGHDYSKYSTPFIEIIVSPFLVVYVTVSV